MTGFLNKYIHISFSENFDMLKNHSNNALKDNCVSTFDTD